MEELDPDEVVIRYISRFVTAKELIELAKKKDPVAIEWLDDYGAAEPIVIYFSLLSHSDDRLKLNAEIEGIQKSKDEDNKEIIRLERSLVDLARKKVYEESLIKRLKENIYELEARELVLIEQITKKNINRGKYK